MTDLLVPYLDIIKFIILNLFVWFSASRLAKKFSRSFTLDYVITFILFFASQVIITELALGILGKLFFPNLFVLNALICALIYFWDRRNIRTKSQMGHTETELFENKTVLFCLAFILGFGLVKLYINLINPPFGWDSLNYHFTFAVEWLKHGNLNVPITINDDPSPTYYPINGSLLYLWLILPFKNVMLADLGQLPFFILAFLATFSIAKKLELTDEYAFFASALFLLVPNYFKQLSIAYVDVMVAAWFLTALYYLFLLREQLSLKNALLFGIAIGLLIGTKTLAITYAALLVLPFLFLILKRSALKKSFSLLACFIAGIILCGGFAYIRNFIQTGNPLYPLDVKMFGVNIFRGVEPKAALLIHFKPGDYAISKILFHEGAGGGVLLFLLPALFLALPLVWLKKRKDTGLFLGYFLVLPLLMFFAWRYAVGLPNTRYLYPLLGIGFLAAFYTLKTMGIPRIIVRIFVILCVISSLFELARHAELGISMGLSFLLLFVIILMRKFWKGKLSSGSGYIFLACIIFVFAFAAVQDNYKQNEYSRYVKNSPFWEDATLAWEWLNDHTGSDNIAYVGRPVPFPLYGGNFKNNVYYVSVNKTEPVKIHYFANSRYEWGFDFESLQKTLEEPNNYRGNADYRVWLNNLMKKNTDHLFIYSLHQTKDIIFPMEDKWANQHADRFNLVFANENVHIYKIIKE
ncbi:MAG: hypothetical protein PHU91_03010 [Candidatus Omnitrophica bacterium]|nr:hypothetical protein [Candidatus Omnitrophota bacterium]MDD5236611.1 hypothetical protein [Candidatus Omnitrophota bacterium]MDD5610182.1 hypothetical protein [Candidatus Omnitrophota bacterium]